MQTIRKIAIVIFTFLCVLQTLYAQKDEAEIYIQKGDACYRKGDMKCAEENYRLYIQFYINNPDRVPPDIRKKYEKLTSTPQKKDNFELQELTNALKVLIEELQIQREKCKIHFQRAKTLFEQKEYEDAKKQYQEYEKCDPRADVEKEIADCEEEIRIEKEEKRIANEKRKKKEQEEWQQLENERIRIDAYVKAKKNLQNGHYLSFGSSIFSSGYYGNLGFGYEYRYRIVGFNISAGYDFGKTIWHSIFYHSKYPSLLIPTFPSYSYYVGGVNVNLGLKFYLGKTKENVKNFYFNFLFLGYMGLLDDYHYVHYPLSVPNVGLVKEQYSLFVTGLFFGYSPVWEVSKSKSISMGFNVDMGVKTGCKFENWFWFPINWDLGLIMKFGRKWKPIN